MGCKNSECAIIYTSQMNKNKLVILPRRKVTIRSAGILTQRLGQLITVAGQCRIYTRLSPFPPTAAPRWNRSIHAQGITNFTWRSHRLGEVQAPQGRVKPWGGNRIVWGEPPVLCGWHQLLRSQMLQIALAAQKPIPNLRTELWSGFFLL